MIAEHFHLPDDQYRREDDHRRAPGYHHASDQRGQHRYREGGGVHRSGELTHAVWVMGAEVNSNLRRRESLRRRELWMGGLRLFRLLPTNRLTRFNRYRAVIWMRRRL